MQHLAALIVRHLPHASRVLWEGTFWSGTGQTFIGYGDLVTTQSRGRKVERFMVGLACRKHVSVST
jgi:hypothetical protein